MSFRSKSRTAELDTDIFFADISGTGFTLKKGEKIEVSVTEREHPCDKLDGSVTTLMPGSIIGSKDKHSFDLLPSEFHFISD